MGALVKREAVIPAIRHVAAQCVEMAGNEHSVRLVEAIRAWVARHFRFMRDPADRELLHSPDAQMRQLAANGYIVGDCDDAAILAAAIGLACGCRTRLVAVGFLDKRAPFSHVWAEVSPPTGLGGEWVECDVTRSFQSVPTHLISRVLVFPIP